MLNRRKVQLFIVVLVILSILSILSAALYRKTFYYTGNTAEKFPILTREASIFPKITDGVWLHRVNSVERLEYFINDFSGFEMDIYYNDALDNFNVDHDNRDYGTTLDDMLATLTHKPEAYLWLDVKNLSAENAKAVFARLEFLFQKHHISKNHVIVESPAIETLNGYAAAGYLTSYYFSSPSGPPTREIMEKARARFYSSDVTAVSADLVYYDMINAAFPSVPHLFWDLKSYSRKPLDRIAALIRKHLLSNNPEVKVLLVRDKTLWR